MSKTLVDCGCEAKVHADGSGVEIYYCPLHGAAPELYEACRQWVQFIDDETYCNQDIFCMIDNLTRAALAKAQTTTKSH